MKIAIVGGHHISALVLAKNFLKQGDEVFWFGCRFPRWPEKTEGVEYRQVRKINKIPFFEIKTGKFHQSLWDWFRIPGGFFQSIKFLQKTKPDIILSFGGYLAVPVVLAGWILGIPNFIHEQTKTAGLANRFLQHFAKKIFLTFPESGKYFNSKKIILTGLPVREILFKSNEKKKIFDNYRKTIFVFGGKQGSNSLNQAVFSNLKEILSTFNLIHQCGDVLQSQDYLHALNLRKKLPDNLKKNYQVSEFFDDALMAQNLQATDFVVCRAGAHTVYELALLGKPAIFVPLPFAFADEQRENANFFASHRAGIIIPQKELLAGLIPALEKMAKNYQTYRENAQKLTYLLSCDATQKITSYLKNYVG